MTEKVRKSKKVKLEKASASEIASSLRITSREARRAHAVVKSVMRAGEVGRSSRRTSKLRAVDKVV